MVLLFGELLSTVAVFLSCPLSALGAVICPLFRRRIHQLDGLAGLWRFLFLFFSSFD